MIEHRAVTHNVRELVKEFGLGPMTRTLQFAAPTFDIFGLDLFMTISCGGCLVMAPLSTIVSDITTFMRQANITYIQLTPTILNMIDPDGVASLAVLASSGEALPEKTASRWRNKIDAACVGLAVPGLEVRLFIDGGTEEVPEGQVGEICVVGPQLFRGYLSTKRAVKVVECVRNGTRYYRTGDLGKIETCPSGKKTIRYLGRRDEDATYIYHLEQFADESRQLSTLSSEVEQRLQSMWAQVLNRPASSGDTNILFIQLGADSLDAIRFIAKARKSGIDISLPQVYAARTIRELARSQHSEINRVVVEKYRPFSLLSLNRPLAPIISDATTACEVAVSEIEDSYLCTPYQSGLMTLDLRCEGSYVCAFSWTLPEDIVIDRFRTTWDHLIARESVLHNRLIWDRTTSAHADSEDVVFGMILAGREAPLDGILDLIDPVFASFPFRAQVDGSSTVKSFLESIESIILSIMPHQSHDLQRVKRGGPGAANACDFRRGRKHSLDARSDPGWGEAFDQEQFGPGGPRVAAHRRGEPGDEPTPCCPAPLSAAKPVKKSDQGLVAVEEYTNEFRQMCSDAQQRLKELLPQQYVPTLFVPVRKMPYTSSSKLDLRRLREDLRGIPNIFTAFEMSLVAEELAV
ncbi:hypothetical protein G7Y89_g9067 [Cudoniella acicularis]|uniref:Carrier domain-containing protein n=1 Tax=Cudoniella acicularis TaxID=354080 RepID=A0A8H4W001_9HELO|nr:hypothetical protein G7Y89_g9067 [Cudoniella acicularis]